MLTSILYLLPYITSCETIINKLSNGQYTEEQLEVCSLVLEESDTYEDVNKHLLIALVWHESMFYMKDTPNSSNCVGPFQIKYSYWCPNKKGEWSPYKKDGVLKNCDLISRGLFTFNYYFSKNKPLTERLCLYGPAKKCKNYKTSTYSKNYVDAVLYNLRRIKNHVIKR